MVSLGVAPGLLELILAQSCYVVADLQTIGTQIGKGIRRQLGGYAHFLAHSSFGLCEGAF